MPALSISEKKIFHTPGRTYVILLQVNHCLHDRNIQEKVTSVIPSRLHSLPAQPLIDVTVIVTFKSTVRILITRVTWDIEQEA